MIHIVQSDDPIRCSRTINGHQAGTFKIAEYMPLALNLKHELEGRLVDTRDDDYLLYIHRLYVSDIRRKACAVL